MFLSRLGLLAALLTAHASTVSAARSISTSSGAPTSPTGPPHRIDEIFDIAHSSHLVYRENVCDRWFTPRPGNRAEGELVTQWGRVWLMNQGAIDRLDRAETAVSLIRAFLGNNIMDTNNNKAVYDTVEEVLHQSYGTYVNVQEKMSKPENVKPAIVCGAAEWLWYVDLDDIAIDKNGALRKGPDGRYMTVRQYETSRGNTGMDDYWWFWATWTRIGYNSGYVRISKVQYLPKPDGSPPFPTFPTASSPIMKRSGSGVARVTESRDLCGGKGGQRSYTIPADSVDGRPEWERKVAITILCPSSFTQFPTDRPGGPFPPTMPDRAHLPQYGINALSLYREIVRALYPTWSLRLVRRAARSLPLGNPNFPGLRSAWETSPRHLVNDCLSAMYLSLYDVAEPRLEKAEHHLAFLNPENYIWFALAAYYEAELCCDFSNGVKRPQGSPMQDVDLRNDIVP